MQWSPQRRDRRGDWPLGLDRYRRRCTRRLVQRSGLIRALWPERRALVRLIVEERQPRGGWQRTTRRLGKLRAVFRSETQHALHGTNPAYAGLY
jgi:hypothetical protein